MHIKNQSGTFSCSFVNFRQKDLKNGFDVLDCHANNPLNRIQVDAQTEEYKQTS